MKKEKVMHVKLPEGAEYQKVEVTADGEIAIHYVEECNENNEAIQTTPTAVSKAKATPKPEPLIGGSNVYQKENETGYWYCKIKGRDEFMYLDFTDLCKKDLLYDAGKKRKFATSEQKTFKENVLKAIENMPDEGFRWIPAYEPSKDENGNIQFVSGQKVLRGLSSYEWEEKANSYSPDNGSQMASITTYFLLLLRWLKDGHATVEQLADDSKDIGHYWDSENAKHDYEKTGERQFGGLDGFVGNTYKIVKDPDSGSGFSVLGGRYDRGGNSYPVADVCHAYSPANRYSSRIGLFELTK